MVTLEHITLSELQSILPALHLPANARLTITFEEPTAAVEVLKRKKAIEAMKKLKGSGNGNLVTVLLEERFGDSETDTSAGIESIKSGVH